MKTKLRVLLIEDRPTDAELMLRELRRAGYETEWKRVETEPDYLAQLDQGWEIILADYNLPQFTGLRALELLKKRGLDIPFVIVSATIGEDKAVEAMKTGASDYVMKDKLGQLGAVVGRELSNALGRHELRQSEEETRASELRYRRLFESAKDGILILDADTGMVVDVNPFLIKLLGFSRESFLEKQIWELGFFRDIVANQSKFLELQQAEYIRYEDKPLETADGRRVDVEFVSNVYRVNHQNVIQCNIRDISERKRAQEAVQKSEHFAQATADALSAHIAVLNEAGVIIAVNRAWRAFAEANPPLSSNVNEGACYLSVCDAANGPDSEEAAAVAAGIRDVLAGTKDEFEIEYPCHSPDTQRWFVCRVRRFPGSGPPHVVVAHENITARKMKENALRKCEAEFRAMFEIASIGMAQSDPRTGRLLRVNKKMCAITGYSAEELLQKGIGAITHPDDRQQDRALFLRVVRNKARDYRMQKRYLRKDGTVAWVNVNMTVIRDDAGQPTRTMATIEDITAHKMKEDALRESEERYRSLFEGSRDAILIISKEGSILNANPAAVKLFACRDEQDLRNRTLASLWPEQQPDGAASEPGALEMIRRALDTGTSFFEWTHRKTDGAEFPAQVSLSRLEIGGHPFLLATVRDITEQLHLEDQFRQSQKMEAVGRLAGGVAHDFNNLLMGIMGFTELCLDEIGPGHPIRVWLDEILVSTKRSAEITRQLLAFARKQSVVPRVLDLNDAVAGMLKLLRRLIGEDINLAWFPGADLKPVRLDPSQVDQILANLCLNARDAIAGVGTINLETKNAAIDAAYCARHLEARPGAYVLLRVSDDGCGMEPGTLAHIFEPFFTTKDVGKGTGLGLATVYGIVKQNNGFLDVSSDPKKGTTFRIYLPRVEAEPEKITAPSIKETPRGRGETILLVEDEKSLRVTCSLFLTKLGYSVLIAETPEEALKMAAGHPGAIDLLLTDVVMPGMDGRQLAERLGSVKPGLKVLFMSGYTADVMAQHGVREGSLAFIAKPFTRIDLAHKVHEILERK